MKKNNYSFVCLSNVSNRMSHRKLVVNIHIQAWTSFYICEQVSEGNISPNVREQLKHPKRRSTERTVISLN